MTTLATAAPVAAPTTATVTAAELAARIQLPRRLPTRYDGQPLRHLSHSSYTKFLLCPEDWRRHYLLGERTAPSGAMFLGSRIDEALSTYYQQLLEHGQSLALDQVQDAYRDQWTRELAAEQHKLGVDWHDELSEQQAFTIGLDAIALAFAELIPHIGRPMAVQRKLEFALAPGLEWTVQGYLDLEAKRADPPDGAPAAAIIDFKVKATPLSQARADQDVQASLYLAARWLERNPAREFCFAQIAKPGPRRKQISASRVSTTRTRPATRHLGADRAGRGPDLRLPRALRARSPVGLRRPQRLEVQRALLQPPPPLPGRRRALGHPPRRRPRSYP